MKIGELTPSELQFGIAPKRGPGIVYQDGVILMEHGDRAIRSFASDGMSWTLDAGAPQVADIKPGKIVFATARCVGKVLAVQRHGALVSVVLGPVQLTELIKKGNFSYDQPVDLNSFVAYAAPDYPGAVNSSRSASAGAQPATAAGSQGPTRPRASYNVVSSSGEWRPMATVYRPDRSSPGNSPFLKVQLPASPSGAMPPIPDLSKSLPAPPVLPKLPTLDFNQMQAAPCALDCGGIGMRIFQQKNGMKVVIDVVFHLTNPHLTFLAAIDDGKIDAQVELHGAAGITASFEAATGSQFNGNIKEIGLIPVDLTFPIGGAFVPLTVNLSQSIDVQSAFSARTSFLRARADVGVSGEIAVRYIRGHWDIPKPTAKIKENLASTVSGLSVGINSFVFGINQRLLVGVGALGFAAGPYVETVSSMSAIKQYTLRLVPCAQGKFNLQLGGGIGYRMPQVVASIINAVLSLFGAKPIPASGSFVNLPERATLLDPPPDQIPQGCAGP